MDIIVKPFIRAVKSANNQKGIIIMIQRFFFLFTMTVSLNTYAAAFSWQLDSLEANGDVSFYDDFGDGTLSLPPTSQLSVFLGMVTESGGALQFTDADGTGVSSNPFPGTFRDTVLLNSSIPDNGSGTTWNGVFIPNLTAMASLPLGSGYGIQINNAGNFDFEQATLSVVSDGIGNTGIGLYNSLNQLVEGVYINSTLGNIVLSLNATPASNLITASYSIDGGSNFNTFSNTISINGDLHAWAFGQVTTVPVPPAVWLFSSGLFGLIGIARRKKHAKY